MRPYKPARLPSMQVPNDLLLTEEKLRMDFVTEHGARKTQQLTRPVHTDWRGHSWTAVTNFDHPTEIKLDKLEAVQKESCNANKGPGNATCKESEQEIGLP